MLLVVAYLGGVLTIISPCILPVLPFVFARVDRAFTKHALPLLSGMAITFAGVATLAAVGGGWAVQANEIARWAALVLLALFGVALLFPRLADTLGRPFTALGERLSGLARDRGHGAFGSFVLGVATGLLWAPCAGPILGLVLAGAALGGPSWHTTGLLLAYAAGAATSLALAVLVGGRLLGALRQRAVTAGEWVRRGLGAAVLAGVVVIALGMDTGLLARVSLGSTTAIEQALLNQTGIAPAAAAPAPAAQAAPASPAQSDSTVSAKDALPPAPVSELPIEGLLPPLSGAVAWLNSPPLTAASLKGKVVLVDFWTYSCINCLRTLPYVQVWADKYKADGLVVIGVHTPEFAFERDVANVKAALKRLDITYPVAVDSNYAIWQAFGNQYWPADYLIDAQGRIRYHAFGEGDYDVTERALQALLKEAGRAGVPTGVTNAVGTGVKAAPDVADIRSPETYIGYQRADGFASGRLVPGAPSFYTIPGRLPLNQWGLDGTWTIGAEVAVLDAAPGRIAFRFHARDLNLVLGPAAGGKPVHFRVTVDGQPPGDDHGVDTDAAGNGTVTAERLYQLVRQSGAVRDRLFEIEFLDPGVQAYSFTFG